MHFECISWVFLKYDKICWVKIYIQQFWWCRVSCVNDVCLWELMATAGDFWAHVTRAHLIPSLDSVTNTMGKSKELSMDLEKQITDLNKSGKSLGAILKQLQVPSSIKCLAQLHHCHDQEENRSGLSRVNQEPTKSRCRSCKNEALPPLGETSVVRWSKNWAIWPQWQDMSGGEKLSTLTTRTP